MDAAALHPPEVSAMPYLVPDGRQGAHPGRAGDAADDDVFPEDRGMRRADMQYMLGDALLEALIC